MKKNLFLVFALFAFMAHAQKQGKAFIDSLLQELPKAKEDTNKLNILDALADNYESINPDEGIKYGQEEVGLAEKLKWDNGIASSYNNIGKIFAAKNDYPNALQYYSKSLNIYKKTKAKYGLATVIGNIGAIYQYQSNYGLALENDNEALQLNEELGRKNHIAINLINIGVIYYDQSNYSKALEYFFRALKIAEDINSKKNISKAAINIGNVYFSQKNYAKALEYENTALKLSEEQGDKFDITASMLNIGDIYDAENNYPGALEYYTKVLKIAENQGEKSLIANSTSNIGEVFMEQHNCQKALEYDFKALKMYQDLGDKNNSGAILGDIGMVYLDIEKDSSVKKTDYEKKADLNNSILYLNESVNILKEVGNLIELQRMSALLSEAQSLSGDFKNALENYKQCVFYKDSIFSQENNIKITNLESQRDLDLKDRDIEIKNKQLEIDRLAVSKKRNERGFFVSGILIIAIVATILFRNYKRLAFQKSEFERLQAVSNERTRIASDMHDDLGAGLTSIRLLSEVANLKTGEGGPAKSEIEKIVNSAGKLSDNLREIIWTMNTKYDKLEDFIIYVRGYAAGFFDGSTVNFQFKRPEKIPDTMMPGELRRNLFLCIKEALNNIMKHAKATETTLSFDITENQGEVWLVTTIKDNGVGIDKSRTNKYGNGLNTMKERLGKFGGNMEVGVDGGTKLVFKVNINRVN